MNWVYQGKEYIEKHSDNLYGFIYKVTFEDEDGKVFVYYGKKKMFSETTLSALKNGTQRPNSKRIRKLKPMTFNEIDNRTKSQVSSNVRNKIVEYDVVSADNDWRSYVGSCKDTKGYIPIRKDIICFTASQREHTYMEVKVLFQRGALEDESCLNQNIMGRFYRERLV